MVTYLFPGQGSQAAGMGKALAERFSVARETFEAADEALQIPLSKLCFEGPESELKRTEITQPAILATSVAALRSLQHERPDLRPTFVAGHSLGEWSALVAAGALAFEDALRLVRIRGRLMQEAVPEGEGAMAAVVGLSREQVIEVVARISTDDAVVAAANFNAPDQTVISGATSAANKAIEALKELDGARVIPLPVSAPFHSPLMKPAADGLAEALETYPVKAPSCPVVTNVEAQPNEDPARVKPLLVQQVTAPVRWVETVQLLIEKGETQALEIGPGRVLMGLARRIDRNLGVLGVQDPDSLEKALAKLG